MRNAKHNKKKFICAICTCTCKNSKPHQLSRRVSAVYDVPLRTCTIQSIRDTVAISNINESSRPCAHIALHSLVCRSKCWLCTYLDAAFMHSVLARPLSVLVRPLFLVYFLLGTRYSLFSPFSAPRGCSRSSAAPSAHSPQQPPSPPGSVVSVPVPRSLARPLPLARASLCV
jgi:hypothetical protein